MASNSLDVTDWVIRRCRSCGTLAKIVRGECEACGFAGGGDSGSY